jgi:ABC-type dipeptide/oligopeptide/nickel transport system permease component/ABC-type transport system substrate-binding protein
MKRAAAQVAALFLAATGVAAVLVWVLSWAYSRSIPHSPRPTDEDDLAVVEALRAARLDPVHAPVLLQEVDYAEGAAAAWYPKGEAPVLADLVAAGRLPGVGERVGPEPAVIRGVDGIGHYGGTWVRAGNSLREPGGVMLWRLAGTTLVRWSPQGEPVVPHVAKSWTTNADQSAWTFHLRRGMRWSDGAPFGADDLIYWWHHHDPVIYPDNPPEFMLAGGQAGTLTKIDDHTVRFNFPQPNTYLLQRLASAWRGWCAPRHYLQRYHPDLGDPDLIAREMERRGLTDPRQLYEHLAKNEYDAFYNPDHPRIDPWIYRTRRTTPPHVFVRNPYYWAVDPAGNQLPYIDRVHYDVLNQKLLPMAAAAGKLSMQARHLRFDQYPLLMANRHPGGYEVHHWHSADRSTWALWPNLNRRVSAAEPASRWKHQLLNQRDFRRALSLAIDRRTIITTQYYGMGEPSQVEPGEDSPFHHPALQSVATAHDPALADRLLDGLGLTRRDAEGFRTFPDGTRMVWYVDYLQLTGAGPVELVVEDWARVGIRAVYRERAPRLFHIEKQSLRHDFSVMPSAGDFDPLVQARSFVPVNSEAHFAAAFASWYQRGGLAGAPDALRGIAEEPPPDHPLRQALLFYEEALRAPSATERHARVQDILALAAENLWSIGIATAPPLPVVVQNGLHNVPRTALAGYYYGTPANTGVETYYFADPAPLSPALDTILREELIGPRTEGTSAENQTSAPSANASGNLAALLTTLVLLSLGVLGWRHRFIGRRLLLMIPTLTVVSIVVFTIVELPPGDYLDSKIIQLQMSGAHTAAADIARLKETYHLDRSPAVRYAHWMGLPWFLTRAPEDKGLLQGFLGRSMESGRSVNELLGDRLLLTVVISATTIAFTWAVALPIGMYCAVRKNTLGDHVLTFAGLLGMCLPNFLLALVLMHLAQQHLGLTVTGLFSPAFATVPGWSPAKVVDLLKHLWVPVIVLGTGGTATMVRIMRGNLLDELRKPYVTTARAKGLRPLRRLLKYPVRLAINPFVSSLGSLFPQLISGGAIVAIVLSLPTIGPLMLEALLSEDLYLAGSLLMVLSLLSVAGTLVSDLLLLWLDPRIRMEGGSR